MAKQFVEHHIQAGGLHTFKVEEGQIVKIGELVEITPSGKVQLAGAGSEKVIGIVYSGTVGIDGKNVGYSGDEDMVASVVVLKPFVYIFAESNIQAGDSLKAGSSGGVVPLNIAGGDTVLQKIGFALETGFHGQRILCFLT